MILVLFCLDWEKNTTKCKQKILDTFSDVYMLISKNSNTK